MMLTPLVRPAAAGKGATLVAGPRDDLPGTAPLELSHRIWPTGEAVVDMDGELDIATAELAVRYVTQVIDRHRGPVIVDLAALGFCDARGLAALLRMAGHAKQAGCPFGLASPAPSLVKIMRITGLDRRFLTTPAAARLIPEGATS
jgi:anti-sigma B factor antagonist